MILAHTSIWVDRLRAGGAQHGLLLSGVYVGLVGFILPGADVVEGERRLMESAMDLRDALTHLEGSFERFRDAMSLPVLLREATPPLEQGVYGLFYEGALRYVGKANGNNGLWDRLINKHLSGDDGHTLQKVLKTRFPDRVARRSFLRENVAATWIIVTPRESIPVLEELLIWSFNPEWNAFERLKTSRTTA